SLHDALPISKADRSHNKLLNLLLFELYCWCMTNIRSHLWGENVHMGDAGPQRISHYAIIRLLNEGPISYTYLGKDEQRKKRYVILKVFTIPLTTKAAQEAFLTH